MKKGHTGTFRLVKPGEEITPSDLIVNDCFYENPSETSVGQPAKENESIMRFEFDREVITRRTIHKK